MDEGCGISPPFKSLASESVRLSLWHATCNRPSGRRSPWLPAECGRGPLKSLVKCSPGTSRVVRPAEAPGPRVRIRKQGADPRRRSFYTARRSSDQPAKLMHAVAPSLSSVDLPITPAVQTGLTRIDVAETHVTPSTKHTKDDIPD